MCQHPTRIAVHAMKRINAFSLLGLNIVFEVHLLALKFCVSCCYLFSPPYKNSRPTTGAAARTAFVYSFDCTYYIRWGFTVKEQNRANVVPILCIL